MFGTIGATVDFATPKSGRGLRVQPVRARAWFCPDSYTRITGTVVRFRFAWTY